MGICKTTSVGVRLPLKRLLMLVLLAFLMQGCAEKPIVGQVLSLDRSMAPGLPVFYRYAFYRHMNQMASDRKMMAEGEPGQIVSQLDHNFEAEANIYDSHEAKGVGVFFPGYLKMSVSRVYRFKAMANDGIQVHVNGVRVVYDPAVHSDRYSGVGEISISAPGWYPLAVKYFQRKGTARLTLYWQTPGATDFVVIPAEALGHLR
jgi:hypothetical protein